MTRTVSVKLMADASDFARKVRGAGADVRGLVGELDKANKAGRLDAATDAATGFGLGLLGAAGAAVKMAADFDKQMSSVRAATHATAGDMNQLRQAALDAGADTKFSATEAAKGIEELSKAGIATKDILGGGLAGALDLAAAGELDVGEAAETAASAMTQFKLKGQDVPHIADLLAAAAGKAQGSVHDMGMALNQSGLVASQMGLSIEETTGTLASFASAGLMGSDAGTSLKTAMLMLANPTAKSRDLMAELGINAYDASGKFVGMAGLAGQLKTQLGGLTQEQRNSALATIFGSDAIRAASVLYEQGSTGIQDWTKKVNDSGYAAETAKIKTDNLAGDVERLTGSLQTLAIESGGGANSGLRVLTQGANGLVDQFALLPSGISGTITVLALLGGAAALGSAGWLKMRRSTADALAELRATGPVGTRAARGLEVTTKWAGRATAAFAAYEIATTAVAAAQGDLNPQIEALAAGLGQYASDGRVAGEASRLLGSDMSDLEDKFKFLADEDNSRRMAVKHLQGDMLELIPGMKGASGSIANTRLRIEALDSALSQMVSGGKAGEAKAAFDRLSQTLAVGGVSMDEFKKQFPQYAASLEVASSASKSGAAAIGQVGASADSAEEQVEALEKAYDDLFKSQMTLDRATIAYQRGIGELSKELKSGEKTIKANTEEGLKNREAVLDQIDVINDLRDSRVKQNMTMEEANRKYGKDIEGLRKSMSQAGFTKKQIDELTGAYRRVPEHVATQITTPNLPQSKAAIVDYDKKIDQVARQIKSQVGVVGVSGAYDQLKKLLIAQQALKKGISVSAAASAYNKNAYATGGRVYGPGTDTSDSIDARLSNDEYVLKAASARKIGYDRLDEANATGELPGFAGGGRVLAAPFPTTAAMTRIPSRAEALAAVTPAIPTSGATSDAIVAAARALVPGIRVLSKDRPGAVTLSGNTSYHARRRAVDFEPSKDLARLWNAHYAARTKEEITPYQQYNLHNGQRHTYTGAVWNQHNFAGGNAHDHIAMRTGGVIGEPVWGVGRSGRSYSFGEAGTETVVPGEPRWLPPTGGPAPITVVVQGGDGTDMAEATAVLRNLLAATQGVGGQVAAALAGSSARALQVARTTGLVTRP